MSDETNVKFTEREALFYHNTIRPGKIEIIASKPMATQRDLSLAYSPGVAVPVQAIADEINWKHGLDRWQPVVFLNQHHGPEDVFLLYRMAAGCVVSSLHDGMNLVVKEFVSARADGQGVEDRVPLVVPDGPLAERATDPVPRAHAASPSTSPLVGTPVPAVTTTWWTSAGWLTEEPRTSRTASAMPFIPCR